MGSIITFYSYKGGTGRSMALANVGVLLSRSNRKILLIDWDLEAPGLHRYFDGLFQDESIELKPGLIDYFTQIQSNVDNTRRSYEETKRIIDNIHLDEFILETTIPHLSIMKAGAFDDIYPQKINTLKWETLFQNAEGLFSLFQELLKSKFDYILIDSRTGYTDSSGICTMILPEKVVLVFTPNSQSLNGVVELMKRASTYRLQSNDLRSLLFYPLPSRIENAEKELREKWRTGKNGYQPTFEEIFNKVYEIDKIDLNHYFNEVQIQHEPKFAYGEQIAVLNEKSKDRLSLSESYNKFLSRLIGPEDIWSSKATNTKKIYVSFEEDVITFANNLIIQLEVAGYVVKKQSDLEAGTTGLSFSNFSKAISESDIIMPLVSEKYLGSRFSKLEMSISLEQKRLYSKIILPIKMAPRMPEEIASEDFVEGRDRNIARVIRIVNQKLNRISINSNEATMIPHEWLQFAPTPRALAPGEAWHVFLSYRSINRPWALNLYDIFTELGFKVFLDQYVLKIGDVLVTRLNQALDSSQAGVLIWSSDAKDSAWVMEEYATLETKSKNNNRFFFVPVKVDSTQLPAFANNKIFVDFSNYPDGPNGGDLLRLLHGIVGQSLSPEAVQFASQQDEQAKLLIAQIKAAVKNKQPQRLLALFQEGALPLRSSPSLGCAIVEGLIKLKNNDEALQLADKIITQFPKSIRPKQLKGLALARRGKPGDLEHAQEVLGTLYLQNNLDPETMGIYARTWMDRYQQSNDLYDLRQSRDLYAEAFERSPDDYYTGINAAAKSIFIGTDEDVAKGMEYASRVEKLVGTTATPDDYWKTATVAEVLLIQKKYAEAAAMYASAIGFARGERGSIESSRLQVKRLLEKLQPSQQESKSVLRVFD